MTESMNFSYNKKGHSFYNDCMGAQQRVTADAVEGPRLTIITKCKCI